MMKWLKFLLLFGLLSLGMAGAQLPPLTVALYEPLTLTVNVPATPANPYDPDALSVEGVFTGPGGEERRVYGYFMQPFSTAGVPEGGGEWRISFTPTLPGDWRYAISSTTPDGTNRLQAGTFTVQDDVTRRGFVEVAPNGRYFQFGNGESFFPVGGNLWWSGEETGGLDAYIEWLDGLAASGANSARLIADTAWFIGLDWQAPAGDYTAEQASAWRFDQVLEAAAERGIYLQVTLIWHQAFIQSPGPPVNLPDDPPRVDASVDWDGHAYNFANGGVMRSPESLWTNPAVEDFLRRKLRYMIARWGHHPHIFAWEVVADVDRLPGFDPDAHLPLINGLLDAVQDFDAHPRLLTVGSRDMVPELRDNPRLDYLQLRVLGSQPVGEAALQVPAVLDALAALRANVDKPILLSEFSLNPWYEPTEADPQGLHLFETFWAGVFGGAAGVPWPLWGEHYIHQQDLYSYYRALAHFTEGIPWSDLAWRPLLPGPISARTVDYASLALDDFNRALRATSPPDTLIYFTQDGVIPPPDTLSSYLYGTGFNAQGSLPQTFIIAPPTASTLRLSLRDIAPNGDALLSVSVNNQPATRLSLATGAENTVLEIPLIAGENRVVLDNLGEDWIEIDALGVADYLAPVRALGLLDAEAGIGLLWVHQRDYTWQNQDALPEPVRYRVRVPGLPPGEYRVEYWDALAGVVVGGAPLSVTAGEVPILELPPFAAGLGVRLFRESGDAIAPEVVTPTRTPPVLPTATPSPTASPSATPSLTTTPSPTGTQAPSATASPTFVASPESTANPTNAEQTSTSEATVAPADEIVPRQTRTPRPGRTLPAPQAELTNAPTLTATPSPSPTPTTDEALFPRQTRTPRP